MKNSSEASIFKPMKYGQNNHKRSYDMMKGNASVLLLVVILIIVAGYLLVRTINNNAARQPIVVAGTHVCLPHRNTSGPVTLECAFGLETEAGEYYALDISELDPGSSLFDTGDRVEVAGTLIPFAHVEERLQKYDIEGSILVSSIILVEEDVLEDSTSINGLTFSRPADFSLAINEDQVLAQSVIPPCAQGFDYCLYYDDSLYEGTNFDSAGVRIKRRDDLVTREACLETQPGGFENLSVETRINDIYATSMFRDVGDAGAGHYAAGTVYRISYGESMCYEFETRIAESQFGNFPEGDIEEFTETDRSVLREKLESIVRGVRIEEGMSVLFPNL